MLTCLFATTFPVRLVHSPVKDFVLSWHITFGQSFVTRLVSLLKPSALAECHDVKGVT